MNKFLNIVLEKLFFSKPKWTFLKHRNFLIPFGSDAKKGFKVLNLDSYKNLSFYVEANTSHAEGDLLFKLSASATDINDKHEDFDVGFFETRAAAGAALRQIKNGSYSPGLSSIKAVLYLIVFLSLLIFLANMVINFTQPQPPLNFGQVPSSMPQLPSNAGTSVDPSVFKEYERQIVQKYNEMQQNVTKMPETPQQAESSQSTTTPANDLLNAMGN